jgi:uncharacterized protein
MECDIYKRLLERLRRMRAVAIGFSGGADCTLLLAVAKQALGERVLALTAVTPFMERQEVADTLTLTSQLGVRHELVELDMPDEMIPNPPERCYICKRALCARLLEVARKAGFEQVLDGSNLDDLTDFRPGLRALRELQIHSPLLECRISKADVRRLSKSLDLPTWNKPTNACLLTRLPIGQRVSMEELHRVEEAERFLRRLGYVWVRVHMHGDLARIRLVPEQRQRLLEEAETIVKTLQELGFLRITMDLTGHRLGRTDPAGSGGDRAGVNDPAQQARSRPSNTAPEGGSRRSKPGIAVGSP